MNLFLKNDYYSIILIAITSRIFIMSLGKITSSYFQCFDKSREIIALNSPFKFLLSWDSFHFLDISKNIYNYEHSLPFFPLFPLMCRYLRIFDSISTSVLLSSIFFVLSAVVLYRLSLLYFNRLQSFISCLFFICNPSSIIFTAPYSESLFSLLFLLGLFYSIKRLYFKASLLFGISCLCRSNGLLFLVFLPIKYALIPIIFMSLFQLFSLLSIWKMYCNFKFFIPYSYIQNKYWSQGFLRFYTVNNTPNIFIGLPIVALSIFYLYQYKELKTILKMKEKKPKMNIFHSLFISPFLYEPGSEIFKLVILLGVQVFMLIFLIHMNIAMRFISYNPYLYWMSAVLTLKYSKSKALVNWITFFIVYGFLYVIMFCSFYPPA